MQLNSKTSPSLKSQPSLLPCGRPKPNQMKESRHTIEVLHQKLKTYLENNQLKYSSQRWKVAKLILSTPEHFHSGEIVQKVQRAYPTIGAATVYRTIKLLTEAELLKETLTDSQGRVIYECFPEAHHDHIVCVDCGEIFEFHNDSLEVLQNKITQDSHFEEVHHRHIVYAKCTYANLN